MLRGHGSSGCDSPHHGQRCSSGVVFGSSMIGFMRCAPARATTAEPGWPGAVGGVSSTGAAPRLYRLPRPVVGDSPSHEPGLGRSIIPPGRGRSAYGLRPPVGRHSTGPPPEIATVSARVRCDGLVLARMRAPCIIGFGLARARRRCIGMRRTSRPPPPTSSRRDPRRAPGAFVARSESPARDYPYDRVEGSQSDGPWCTGIPRSMSATGRYWAAAAGALHALKVIIGILSLLSAHFRKLARISKTLRISYAYPKPWAFVRAGIHAYRRTHERPGSQEGNRGRAWLTECRLSDAREGGGRPLPAAAAGPARSGGRP